jgi:hypothetical protein
LWNSGDALPKNLSSSYLYLEDNVFSYSNSKLAFDTDDVVEIPAYILIEYARQEIEKVEKNKVLASTVISFPTVVGTTSVNGHSLSGNVSISSIMSYNGSEVATKNDITKGMKDMAKVADIVSSTLEANKQAVTTVVEITIGKATIKTAKKLIKPKLPMFLKGYADSPIFDVVIANMLQVAVETRFKDNEKLRKLSKATMTAAALTIADHFDIDGMIDNFINSITLPKGVSLEDIED